MKWRRWILLLWVLLFAGPDCHGCFDVPSCKCEDDSDCREGAYCGAEGWCHTPQPYDGGGWCDCAPGVECVDGECVCVPDCTWEACGAWDGCGGICRCGEAGVPVDDDGGTCARQCVGVPCDGADGCGGLCGCAPGGVCEAGACRCVPDCTGRECGDDGCGGTCGECEGGRPCAPDAPRVAQDGFTAPCLVDEDCRPGLACHLEPDALEGRCDCGDGARWDEAWRRCMPTPCDEAGRCGARLLCIAGFCVAPERPGVCCRPMCEGRECGDDGCGGTCGDCAEGRECRSALCVDPTQPPLCRACDREGDCPDGWFCRPIAEAGHRFCTRLCDRSARCPDDFECRNSLCGPIDGACTCDVGEPVPCSREDEAGHRCDGARTCVAERGWVCDAPAPTAAGCGAPDAGVPADGGASGDAARPDAGVRDAGAAADAARDTAPPDAARDGG
jgi:hypothetical protein